MKNIQYMKKKTWVDKTFVLFKYSTHNPPELDGMYVYAALTIIAWD